MQPVNFYHTRIGELEAGLTKLTSRKSLLGWIRLVAMILLAGSIYLWVAKSLFFLIAAMVLLVAFVKIVFLDIDNNKAIDHQRLLIEINKHEIEYLNGNYHHFEDGAAYHPHEHYYANDLDIFGKASLYQYINRTTSDMGGLCIAGWLLNPASVKTIYERQEANKELSEQFAFRQSLQAFGKEKKITRDTFNRLSEWLKEENIFLDKKLWQVLSILVPIVMVSIVALNIFDIVSDQVRNIALVASGLLAWSIAKKITAVHAQVSRITDELDSLADAIKLIEETSFKSAYLLQLQAAFKQNNTSASKEMRALKNIVQKLDWRLNPVVFIPLVLLTQWDLQQVLLLEKWKRRNAINIIKWFKTLGEFEAISSFATLHFNHSDWCFPALKDEYFFIDGKELGHPLINSAKRVNNYVDIESKGKVMIVTGSNMAGKSTYLRSIGINTILAMAGSAVCAKSFTISPVQLLTSMRIADNLEESTSTFYAELKKLKTVIDKVNNNEKVFILLDEILRGTNSYDRHTGAVALTKQLIKQQAAAIIATHDVELAKLKEAYPNNILNYHFDVQVNNQELYFDYRLKDGICTSLNASILMKKIGIEI